MTKGSARQWLVRFQNRTYTVLDLDRNEKEETLFMKVIADQTGWSRERLYLVHCAYPFASVGVVSRLRGGKGGFGTLLKGQSKQAGAKMTTDFGACRDLQGRRLRHVNDEIKLRKWREMQRRQQNGEEVSNDYMMDTPSGLYNWYLMVPHWASITNKATRKLQRNVKRQYDRWKEEEDAVRQEKRAREERYQQGVQDYIRQTEDASSSLSIMDAVQQGLSTKRQRNAQDNAAAVAAAAAAAITDDEDEGKPTSLVTLSGDLVVEETNNGWNIQSKTDFGTMALVLDRKPSSALYWEVQLETGGLAQVGWADLTNFRPNSESGDGVGDDRASYGIDGSRQLKFHGGKEETYGTSAWKAGDVVGCLLDSGSIRYTHNGKEMGEAFRVDAADTILVPALSCNQGEILELHITKSQMRHMPPGAIAVSELMQTETDAATTVKSDIVKDSKPDTKGTKPVVIPDPKQTTEPPTKKPKPSTPEKLDLEAFDSVDQLVELGMERLKSALLAIQVKCG